MRRIFLFGVAAALIANLFAGVVVLSAGENSNSKESQYVGRKANQWEANKGPAHFVAGRRVKKDFQSKRPGPQIFLDGYTITPVDREKRVGPQRKLSSEIQTGLEKLGLRRNDPTPYVVRANTDRVGNLKLAIEKVGGQVLSFQRHASFIVRMTQSQASEVAGLEEVEWVGLYKAEYRVSKSLENHLRDLREGKPKKAPSPFPERFEKSRELIEQATQEAEPESATPTTEINVNIVLFQGEKIARTERRVRDLGGKVNRSVENKRVSIVEATLPADRIEDLASLPEIRVVHLYVEPELHNDIATDIMGISGAAGVRTTHGLTGSGQIIGHADSGLDVGSNDSSMHDDLEGRIVSAYALGRSGTGDWSDLTGHGTHTAGSILGDGSVSGGRFAGSAPGAQLVHQSLGDAVGSLGGIPPDIGDLFDQAYGDGARIHSDSWGANVFGLYYDHSLELDTWAWNSGSPMDMLIVASAGNSGPSADTLGSPATAKNCLTVGASENLRPAIDSGGDNTNDIASFSSRGPTDDGRTKPDLVAPGTWIVSARTHHALPLEDHMENGVNGWTEVPTSSDWAQTTSSYHSGSTCWTDSPSGNYGNDLDIYLISPVFDGVESKYLEFWGRWSLMETGDYGFYIAYNGGSGWTFYKLPSQNPSWPEWEKIVLEVPAAFRSSPTVRVAFNLYTDSSGTADGIYIDDVRTSQFRSWDDMYGQGLATLGDATDDNYTLNGGTSMSTPLVAGAAALARQYFMDVENVTPSAELIKAILINGAVDPTTMTARPDYDSGWGRLDLENSLYPPHPRAFLFDYLSQVDDGESVLFDFTVTSATEPLKVTLVWADRQGSTLQNDLDLLVNGVGLSPRDDINNVEGIDIASATTGLWKIEVRGFSVPYGPQPFALVISGGVEDNFTIVKEHSTPQPNLDLHDWRTTESLKMSVLRFALTDKGGDGLPTLVDRLVVDVSGTAGAAANDIAWAELVEGATIQVATSTFISNAEIVFGTGPIEDGSAELASIPEAGSVEYTINIYLNESLTGDYGETYVFDVDETGIGADTNAGTPMAKDTEAITPVVGTLAPGSEVVAHTSPRPDFALFDSHVTEASKVRSLAFQVRDGAGDGLPTLIDGVVVEVSGTAGEAAHDIAWAELYRDGVGQVAVSTASIANNQIPFGTAADGNGVAGLCSIAEGATAEFALNLYLDGSILGTEGETYIFSIDEEQVAVDTVGSTRMKPDSHSVTPTVGYLAGDPSESFNSGWTVDSNVNGPRDIHVADIDGDYDTDILVAASFDNDIYWLENTEGDGSVWDKHSYSDFLHFPTSVFAADMDQDDDLDIVAASQGVLPATGRIVWYENDGTYPDDGSRWPLHKIDGDFSQPWFVYAVDLDQDGDTDVVGSSAASSTLHWWKNTSGDGTAWSEHTVTGDPAASYTLDVADLDGDDDPDILGASFITNRLRWLENTSGNASTWTQHLIDPTLSKVRSGRAVDLDNDGDLDVLAALLVAHEIRWWENAAGDGSVWTPHLIASGFQGARDAVAADFDQDGDMDVAGVAYDGDDVSWWKNIDGTATLWTQYDLDTNLNGALTLEAADLDIDSDTDIVAAALDADSVRWYENQLLENILGIAVSPDNWTIGPLNLEAVVESGSFLLTHTGNVLQDYSIQGSNGVGTGGGSGWILSATTGWNGFMLEADRGDDGSYETTLGTSRITFATHVLVSATELLGLRYSAPTVDTLGAGVPQDVTITLKASRSVP